MQRDFGLYIVNLYDTFIASKLLNLKYNSLKFLLKLYCNFEAQKQY